MYLLDTNIWLERLLDQEKSNEVSQFLNHIHSEQIFITNFTFHSVAIVLGKLNKIEALLKFVNDTFIDGAVSLKRPLPNTLPD